MKILLFEPYAYFKPHYATALEIAENHLDRGDQVIFIGCEGRIISCDINLTHNPLRCLRCKSIRSKGYQLLSKSDAIKKINTHVLSPKEQNKLKSLRLDFESFEDLKSYSFEDFDIGYAVASSLIWNYRNPYFEKSNFKLKKQISDLIKSAATIYLSLKNQIDEHQPDRVYIFNGRLALLRGVLRYCQTNNIECYVHERGSNIYKYDIFKNNMPHNIKYIVSRIKKNWSLNKPNKEQDAIAFYHERRKGINQDWKSFTKNQRQNELPSTWDNTKSNIVIFNSSEDEFSAIGDEWNFKLYKNQLEGIRKILESFKFNYNYHFYLRIHPNLIGIKNKSVEGLYALKQDNFTPIPPESLISTYSLMLQSDKIVTFGSTTGVEATFWDKPSILLGPSFYRDLDVTYNPKTHEELVSLITSNLRPKDKEGALMYGSYLYSRGTKFKYYQPNNFVEGTFKGVPLEEGFFVKQLVRFNKKIKNLFNK